MFKEIEGVRYYKPQEKMDTLTVITFLFAGLAAGYFIISLIY